MRADLLSERRGRRVEFLVPQRGDKLRLCKWRWKTRARVSPPRRDHENTREKMLDELRTRLHLRNSPKRIECYDISNLQGSMVVDRKRPLMKGCRRKHFIGGTGFARSPDRTISPAYMKC